jgi:type I restriction enzyme S subunit
MGGYLGWTRVRLVVMRKEKKYVLTGSRGEHGNSIKYKRTAINKDWQWKQLGEVCKTGSGGTPLKAKKEYYEGGVIPWLMSGEVCKKDIRATLNFITQKGLDNSSARIFPKDTVLVAMYGATAGQVGILRNEATTNQAVCGILPNKLFLPEFLYYFLLSKKEELVGQATGNAQPNISQIKIKNTDVPMVALPEQQRIVAILDEAFAGIAIAKANTEKNLHNAHAIFESHLQSVFTQRGEGWVDRQLASLCHEITVGHVGPMKTEYKESGIPFLRSQNIRPFEVSMENAMFIDDAFHRALKKSQLRPGDLAIVRTGYPGTAAVIPPELLDSNCSDLVIVRPTKEVNPYFLAAFFNSEFGKRLVLGKIVGAAQKHFNINAAKEVMLHIPPIRAQLAIIDMVDSIRAETRRLESIYRKKLAALDEFKKSLLDQAFSGRL